MSQDLEVQSADPPDSFTPPALEELSRMLPQYEITNLIAQGGMGAVYSGIQRGLDRPVAIKVLPPEMGRDPESAERFRTEAKAMARLTNPHIPTVFDFTVTEDHCVLVMELVDGPNVYSLIRQGKVSPPLALEIMAQICDAVHFAHARDIIHGDIKPGNILINPEGQAKLADFGLARLAGSGDAWSAMGTPEYAAPEIYDKHAVPDYRADIYSLGVVLHEMLTGSAPVGEFELPAESMGLDPRVDEVIAKCMELNPASRYKSAADIGQVLRDIIEKRNIPVSAVTKQEARRITRAGRRAPVVVKPRGPASQVIPAATQHPLGSAPLAEVRPARFRPAGMKKVLKVVGQSGGGGLTDDVKRGLMIGAVLLVFGFAFWLMNSGGGKPQPDEKKGDAASKGDAPSSSDSILTVPVSGTDGVLPGTASEKPVPVPPPDKKPEGIVKPSKPKGKPTKFLEKFEPVRAAWRDQWGKKVEDKIQREISTTGDFYVAALQKLDDASLAKGDADAVIAVREERKRWDASKDAPQPTAISSIPELAKLQQQLTDKLTQLSTALKYDADKVKEEYLAAIKKLEGDMDKDEDNEGSKLAADEFSKVVGMDDRAMAKYFNSP